MVMKAYSSVDIKGNAAVEGVITATSYGTTDASAVLVAGHKMLEGAGAPTGSVQAVPGQLYRNTTDHVIYICKSVTDGNRIWEVVASVLNGTTAPTTSTVGFVGQLYTDTVTQLVYVCYAVATSGGTTTYSWEPAGAKITLNGSSTTNASFYAPTTSTEADTGKFLISNGTSAPIWKSLTGPLQFKGTVGTSGSTIGTVTWESWPPTGYEVGWTYKVIQDAPADTSSKTYPRCLVGDSLICNNKSSTSQSVSDWEVVPSGDEIKIISPKTETSGSTTTDVSRLVMYDTNTGQSYITTGGTIGVDTDKVLCKDITSSQTVIGPVVISDEDLSLGTKTFRNISAGTANPSGSDGANGDIYIQYGGTAHLGTVSVGNSTTPVYFDNGEPKVCTFGLYKKTGTITIPATSATSVVHTVSDVGFDPKVVQIYDTSSGELEKIDVETALGTQSFKLYISAAHSSTAYNWVYQAIGW